MSPSTSQCEVDRRLATLEGEDNAEKVGLTILAADVLCVELHQLMEYISLGCYPRYRELRNALHAFEEIRFDGIIKGYAPSETFRRYIKENDPRRDPAVETERSGARP